MKGIPYTGPMILALLNTKPGVWPAEPIDQAMPLKWQTRRVGTKFRYEVGETLYVRESLYRRFGGYVCYAADDLITDFTWPDHWTRNWQPPMFMPEKFARIQINIAGRRREQVQDISENDAMAEGTAPWFPRREIYPGCTDEFKVRGGSYRNGFHELWDSIHGKDYPWASNPDVVVYDFMRVT